MYCRCVFESFVLNLCENGNVIKQQTSPRAFPSSTCVAVPLLNVCIVVSWENSMSSELCAFYQCRFCGSEMIFFSPRKLPGLGAFGSPTLEGIANKKREQFVRVER